MKNNFGEKKRKSFIWIIPYKFHHLLQFLLHRQLNVPEDGVLVHGLYMDGCRWDMETMKVVDSIPGEMNSELPMLHMEPNMDIVQDPLDYDAPLYKTSERAGVLSTTGIIHFLLLFLDGFLKNSVL